MPKRRLILLTNDDGIRAPGLLALIEPLLSVGEVVVVAPHEEQSGVSHSIVYRRPVACERATLSDGVTAWSVDAYPVDCVKVAFDRLLGRRPDLVVSGINKGANLGGHLFYSGTVAAALEASVMGVMGLAVSLAAPGGGDAVTMKEKNPRFDFDRAAEAFLRVLREIDRRRLGPAAVNINVPSHETRIRGIRWAHQCGGPMPDTYQVHETREGREILQMRSKADEFAPEADSDRALLAKGYVTLTPMRCDLTCRRTLAKVRRGKKT